MRFIVIGGGCYGLYHTRQLSKAIQKGKLPLDSQLIVVDRNLEPRVKKEFPDQPNLSFIQKDWQSFLLAFFDNLALFNPVTDLDQVQIIPPPFAPHLYFDWLRFSTRQKLIEMGLAEIQVQREGFEYKMQLPYEFSDKTGNHFLSRAGWTCPATCIEPHLCPAVKGVRDWDLEEDLRNFVNGKLVKPSISARSQLEMAKLNNGGKGLIDLEPHFEAVETFLCHHFIFGIGAIAGRKFLEARERMLRLALSLGPEKKEARVAVGTLSHCHGVVATLYFSFNSGSGLLNN